MKENYKSSWILRFCSIFNLETHSFIFYSLSSYYFYFGKCFCIILWSILEKLRWKRFKHLQFYIQLIFLWILNFNLYYIYSHNIWVNLAVAFQFFSFFHPPMTFAWNLSQKINNILLISSLFHKTFIFFHFHWIFLLSYRSHTQWTWIYVR